MRNGTYDYALLPSSGATPASYPPRGLIWIYYGLRKVRLDDKQHPKETFDFPEVILTL